MSISASLVKELRERTGAGMMECKKFLLQTDGDIEKAIEAIRKAGHIKAEKRQYNTAAEGRVVFAKSEDGKEAVLLEINCETDFVAKDENFVDFTEKVAQTALFSSVQVAEELAKEMVQGTNNTIEEARQELITKIGENIQLRRMVRIKSEGVIGAYLHGSRIGVLVSLQKGEESLAKDIAMQITAKKPLYIRESDVPQELLDKEREIYAAQAKNEKMIEGRLRAFLEEVSLLSQPFIKESSKRIQQLLQENHASMDTFVRFEVGEGMEKKEDNFVAEVMAQVRDRNA